MKTQIIQLNRYDDHISVREKMSWSQARRILLVWPRDGRVLNRQVDLQLVLRHAANLGAHLALVTNDRQVRYYANRLGIAVFLDPRSAQETEWSNKQPPEIQFRKVLSQHNLAELKEVIHSKTPAWVDHPFTRVICLTISILALFALVIFILPGAKITLTPQVEDQAMLFDLIADPTTDAINYSTGSLPSYRQEVIVEGSAIAPSTSSVTIPDQPATGDLRFVNTTDHVIIIPAGTVISTEGDDPVEFITTADDDIGIDPDTSATLTAQAMKPGPAGNLAANQLVVIEGNLGQDLMVTNPAPMQGGTESIVPSPSEQDLSNLRQQLMSKIMQKAEVAIQSSLPEGDILITPTITNVETISETIFPSVGEAGRELELSLRIRVQSQAISRSTLIRLVNPIMDANTPQGYSPLSNSMEITPQGNPNIGQDGRISWTVRASRSLQADIPAQLVVELIRGNNPTQAGLRLAAVLPLTGQAKIILTPKWWPMLPFLTMRIEVVQNEIQ